MFDQKRFIATAPLIILNEFQPFFPKKKRKENQ